MQWDYVFLKKDHMLFSKGNSKPTDDTRHYVQELCCAVELVNFMNQSEECLINGLPYHLSPRHKLSVQFMKNVFEIVSFY
jgi:hypothetical protein